MRPSSSGPMRLFVVQNVKKTIYRKKCLRLLLKDRIVLSEPAVLPVAAAAHLIIVPVAINKVWGFGPYFMSPSRFKDEPGVYY